MIKITLGILTAFVLCATVNAADNAFPEDGVTSRYPVGSNPGSLTQSPDLDITKQPHFLEREDRSVSDVRQRNMYDDTASQACCRHWCGWILLGCYYCSKRFGDDSSGD